MLFEDKWNELSKFLNKEYHKPDLEALRITLCTQLSHYWITDKPVWLTIVGPPGCGKTELMIGAVELFGLDVQSISNMKKDAFLSGWGEDIGILATLTENSHGNGILTFPDLSTTLLSLHKDERTEIMGIMRSIGDGKYTKPVGNRKEPLKWEGKVTCIAASTPEIEDFWLINRDLGERWVNINVQMDDNPMEYARKAAMHVGREVKIRSTFSKLVKAIMYPATRAEGGQVTEEVAEVVTGLAMLTESLRMNVRRDYRGKVLSIGNAQTPTRMSKWLTAVVRASSAMRDAKEINSFDLRVAQRIAMDSIPSKRRILIDSLLSIHPNPISKQELAMMCKLPVTMFALILEDLRYLQVINLLPRDAGLENPENGISSGNGLLHTMELGEDKDLDRNHIYNIKTTKRDDMVFVTPKFINLLEHAKQRNPKI